jgi:hypothetical protein
MMASTIGSKKVGRNPGAENGQKDLKEKRADTSDSATPETGDEADDDRTSSEKWRVEGDPLHPNDVDHAEKEEKRGRGRLNEGPASVEEIVFDDGSDSGGHEIRLKSALSAPSNVIGDGEPDTRTTSVERRLEDRSGSDLGPEEEKYEDHSEDQDGSDSNISPKQESLLWKARMKCGKIVNNEYVQISIITLILANALMMGIATLDWVTENPDVDHVFDQIDKGFLVVFTIEVVMQLFYLGLALFVDGWLVFDLLIVIFSWSFEGLQIVRAFRIFRAFRLITRVKPLRDLVLAIGAVLPRMYAIAALLMLIFYIFSVLFTELFSDLPLSENYFTTLDASLFTCMEMMTLEWGEIARETMQYRSWAWAPFTAFIAITGFIVFNLIVAVVCDAVAVTEKTSRELDGFESDDPEGKLIEAQERIDLLQCHIGDMLRTQQAVQEMIDLMAGELLHLEAERMKAEHREAELRIEMERRASYQKSMESARQIESLERNFVMEKERRGAEKRMIAARRSESSENLTDSPGAKRRVSGHVVVPHIVLDGPRPKRRGSTASSRSGSRPALGRELSHESFKSSSSRESRNSKRQSKRGIADASQRSGDSLSDL